ncbi:hypothetical protein J6590_059411 [Homalodisca vitripennis]|nr:hypothetical protein J6590_059411 [Homalodisca vitripennis]
MYNSRSIQEPIEIYNVCGGINARAVNWGSSETNSRAPTFWKGLSGRDFTSSIRRFNLPQSRVWRDDHGHLLLI